MKYLSIIIPVFNSEQNLQELHNQLHDALKTFDYEIIFINDKSTDNSWNIISDLCVKHFNIIGINLRKNCGQDNAIMAGLNVAKGEYSVIMDDDLQHSPYDIIKLVNKCKEGYDVCYANFKSKKQKLWKNLGSWFNGKMAEILIQKPKGIYLSPFEIIHHKVVAEIIKYKGAYPYIQGLILRNTDQLTQIEVEHHKRYKGKSNFNLIRSITVFLKLVTSFSIIPLRIATITGFVSACIGFLLMIFYVYLYIKGESIIEGWTTLIVINLLIGGIILICLGIIGEYIGRMYLNVNNKPQFIIKEMIKSKKNDDGM